MMPYESERFDFRDDVTLKEMLMHQKLAKDKFGAYPSKHVKISRVHSMYQADRAFLEMLLDKYGNISFYRAYEKRENDK